MKACARTYELTELGREVGEAMGVEGGQLCLLSSGVDGKTDPARRQECQLSLCNA